MEKKQDVISVFLNGARNGVNLWINSMIPGVVLGYTLIEIFNLTGILKLFNIIFKPIMAIFNLPGEAMSVLITGWMSVAGGTGAAASLAAEGVLTGEQVTVLLPMIFLMGSQVQFIGRILAVSGVESKKYPFMCLVSVINAIIAGLIMRFVVF